MLGKLLKHEFRATGRIMWSLYLVMLALSFGANLSLRMLEAPGDGLLGIFGGLLMAAFVIAVIGVCVMSLVLMINRFRTNLMSDEGYLMFTLPVSVHQLIWSKIIVSSVWFAATFLAVILSSLIAFFRVTYISQIVRGFQQMFSELTAYYAFNGVTFILEAVILAFLGCAAACLLFYASMAVGHSFSNHKILLSVVFFFLFQFVTQIIGSVSLFNLDALNLGWNLTAVASIHTAMVIGIFCTALYGAAFYVVTSIMLKKHLNLE